jgi:crotonobetainyl-CoA:carnitine CoA-transferase CaiB-like acyl-CoA transferase
MSRSTEALPLSGIRVLDAGQVISGPFVAQLLGDFGADVIKIEHPRTGDPYRQYGPSKDGVPLGWTTMARNKRSLTLDLSKPEGTALFKELAAVSDVVIESFRPSTIERYGLTYDDLSAVNPRLVVVLISGFGQTGPYRDRAGFGTLAEAMSGFAAMTGEADGPPILPQFALADGVAALYAAFGVLNALYARDMQGSGRGQLIDVSLIEPLFSLLGPLTTYYDQLGEVPERLGSRNAVNAPRNVYRTKDDRWLAIAASVQEIARRTFAAIGRPELIEDERFNTAHARVAHVEDVDRLVGAWVAERTREDALDALLAAGVAAAPVLDIADMFEDPHVAARQMITEVAHPQLGPIRMHGVFPRMSGTPGAIRSPGPALGEHTDEILRDLLGADDERLAALRAAGVI